MAGQTKQPRNRVVRFYDDDAVAAYEQARSAWQRAVDTGTGDLDALTAAVDVAYQHVQDTAAAYRVRALGAKPYERLLAAHAPTEADHEKVREAGGQRAPWSLDGFPRALILASCVEPALTEADVEHIFEMWNEDEAGYLFAACLDVNLRISPVMAELNRASSGR